MGNSKYYNYTLSVDGVAERHGDDYQADYLTDLLARRGKQFIQERERDRPLLLVLATPASHAPFTPAPQYSEEFPGLTAPRIPSYNVDSGQGLN